MVRHEGQARVDDLLRVALGRQVHDLAADELRLLLRGRRGAFLALGLGSLGRHGGMPKSGGGR